MITWVINNIGTIMAATIVLAIAVTVFVIILKDKKKGKPSCGCNCAHCVMSSFCHKSK